MTKVWGSTLASVKAWEGAATIRVEVSWFSCGWLYICIISAIPYSVVLNDVIKHVLLNQVLDLFVSHIFILTDVVVDLALKEQLTVL